MPPLRCCHNPEAVEPFRQELVLQPGHVPVEATRPIAAYVGGKRSLARRIGALIDATPHDNYAEPFVGMGGVFLRRTSRPAGEAINDRSEDVANLFRVLQRHPDALLDQLAFQLTSRSEFDRQRRVDPTTLTDLERAARFVVLQRQTFGGKVVGRTFGISVGRKAALDVTHLAAELKAVHRRLAGVWIDCLPFEEFIRRYDRPGTLFYCDPPYWGTEDYYGADLFPKASFELLAQTLRGLKGRFILSLNDVPEVRALFSWADIAGVELTYTAGGGGAARPAREVIITPR